MDSLISYGALAVSIGTVIAGYGFMKAKVSYLDKKEIEIDDAINGIKEVLNQHIPIIRQLKDNDESIRKSLNSGEDRFLAMEQKITNAITMIEADKRYVSKEVFEAFQKHMDERFDIVNDKISKVDLKLDKILDKLNSKD